MSNRIPIKKIALFFIDLLLCSTVYSERNKLIRVDGINPTCFRRESRPSCREYELDGAVINVDKSLPFMGGSKCCIHIKQFKKVTHNFFLAKVLPPTYFGGSDYVSFYSNNFAKRLAHLTEEYTEPYLEIITNASVITIEFDKDKNFKSVFEILIVSFYNAASNSKCIGNDFLCISKRICINQDLVCDKYPHCPDAEDEENCTYTNNTQAENFKNNLISVSGISFGILVVLFLLTLIYNSFKSKTKCFRKDTII